MHEKIEIELPTLSVTGINLSQIDFIEFSLSIANSKIQNSMSNG